MRGVAYTMPSLPMKPMQRCSSTTISRRVLSPTFRDGFMHSGDAASVRDFPVLHLADLAGIQGHDRDCLAIERHELDLERPAPSCTWMIVPTSPAASFSPGRSVTSTTRACSCKEAMAFLYRRVLAIDRPQCSVRRAAIE